MLARHKEGDDDRLNVKVAQAAQPIVPALATLPATSRIPAAALVVLRCRFAGELVDVEAVPGRALASVDIPAYLPPTGSMCAS